MVSNRIRRTGAFALLAVLCSVGATAEVQVWLDPETIGEGENTELNIRINDVQSAPEIDLSSLGPDVEVISNSSNSQLRSINGRVETWTTRTLTLRPRRTGEISIGPIAVGSEQVDALTLNVAPLSTAVRAAIEETLFFETALLEDSIYVQSQATYVRKLFYAEGAQLYGDLPSAPAVEAALVVALPEVSPYRESRNGRSYGVLEQRYAIFPEQPGRLTVGGASVTGSIVLRDGGRARRRGIVVKAEEVGIDVASIPTNYPANAPWFPARSVRLEQRWDADIDTMMVGTPITRSIIVSAENATSSLIPPVVTSLGELNARSYDEAPELTESAAGTDVIGAREQRTSIVPTASGTSTLPAVEVTWFDTATEQVKVARLAPRTLLIVPDPTAPQPDAREVSDASPDEENASSHSSATGSWPWMLATLGACVGWLLTSLYLLRNRTSRRSTSRTGLSQESNSDSSTAGTAKTLDNRQLRKTLSAAAKSEDLPALRRLLDQWLLNQYGNSLPNATRQWRSDPSAASALNQLDAALYAPAGKAADHSASAEAIAQAVLAAIDASENTAAKSEADTTTLPDLYASRPSTG